MSSSYAQEKAVAIAAVVRACHLTSSVFASIRSTETVTKSDASPVTVADFSAQAVVNSILASAFPEDPIVGEEDSKDLRGEEAQALQVRITELANAALRRPLTTEGVLQEKAEWGIGENVSRTTDELLDAIDRGTYEGGSSGRMWCLDPIDGTKGFLRGGQYAVCLAFIVDSVVQVGVIGCPNLPLHNIYEEATPGQGSIYVSVRGEGAERHPFPFTSSTPIKLSIPSLPDPPLRFLESVEDAHSDKSLSSRVASALNVTLPPFRADSQAKYCAVAAQTSGGDMYIRLPVPGKNYIEKIWDHAAGSLIIEEAGGVISDTYGHPLNFGLGRTLGENKGIVACAKGETHRRLVNAFEEVRAAHRSEL